MGIESRPDPRRTPVDLENDVPHSGLQRLACGSVVELMAARERCSERMSINKSVKKRVYLFRFLGIVV